MVARFLNRILGLKALDAVVEEVARRFSGGSVFQAVQRKLDLRFEVSQADLERIPPDGPLIVVANHPMGAAEGVALPALLDSVRDDLKVLAHSWFQRWPLVAERMNLVNPQAKAGEKPSNSSAMQASVAWLRQGRMLLLFPAGEVARFRVRARCVADSEWQNGLARLVKATRATVVPVHISGRNSGAFQLLSLVHTRLGALLLGRELLGKRGKSFRVRIGSPIRYRHLPTPCSMRELTTALRNAVEALGGSAPTSRSHDHESACQSDFARSVEVAQSPAATRP